MFNDLSFEVDSRTQLASTPLKDSITLVSIWIDTCTHTVHSFREMVCFILHQPCCKILMCKRAILSILRTKQVFDWGYPSLHWQPLLQYTTVYSVPSGEWWEMLQPYIHLGWRVSPQGAQHLSQSVNVLNLQSDCTPDEPELLKICFSTTTQCLKSKMRKLKRRLKPSLVPTAS